MGLPVWKFYRDNNCSMSETAVESASTASSALQSLNKEELAHYQELFSIFDKEDNGTMPTSQFTLFVRGLGHCPTQAELETMRQQLDPQEVGHVTFQGIVELLMARTKETTIEEEIIEAFEGIQSETGSLSDAERSVKMSVKEAKKYLMEFGESLTEGEAEQFQEFLDENHLRQGIEFNFHDLAKIMAYSYHN